MILRNNYHRMYTVNIQTIPFIKHRRSCTRTLNCGVVCHKNCHISNHSLNNRSWNEFPFFRTWTSFLGISKCCSSDALLTILVLLLLLHVVVPWSWLSVLYHGGIHYGDGWRVPQILKVSPSPEQQYHRWNDKELKNVCSVWSLWQNTDYFSFDCYFRGNKELFILVVCVLSYIVGLSMVSRVSWNIATRIQTFY